MSVKEKKNHYDNIWRYDFIVICKIQLFAKKLPSFKNFETANSRQPVKRASLTKFALDSWEPKHRKKNTV